MPQVNRRTCSICEANCGILVTTEDRRVLSIKGDPDNMLSRGHICPKAVALADLQDDPDRLRVPHKRVGEDWHAISWAQAFAEIGEKVRAILARDPAAAGIYSGNPNAHSFSNGLNSAHLKKALRTRNVFSASTVDQIPHQVVNLALYGHSALWSIPDIDRTQTLVILGGNPMASNGSLWTVPDFRNRVKALHARGGQLVVIDPRRTETAEIADRHLFVRPATDVFLLVALLKAVLARRSGVVLPDWIKGMAELEAALARFNGEACAEVAGVSLADIDWLAQRLTTGPAVLYGRLGISTQETGTLNAWLITLVNIAAGQLDREGGLVFPLPAVDLSGAFGPGTVGRYASRVSQHPEVLGEFPAAAMAEEIETIGPGQIKALFVIAGNPALSTPNGTRLERALEQLELLVSVDMYRNATSSRAHYILPPTGPLEREHYGMFMLPMAVRNFAKYSASALAPEAGALHDWEILRALATAITGEAVQAPTPHEALDALLQRGPYGVTLAEVEAEPSGKDFGLPQAGQLPARLRTAEHTLDCAPPQFLAALAALELPEPEAAARYPLSLIGRRHVRSNNSWLGNSKRLVKGPERCTLMISPADAEARGLSHGSMAEVRSASGTVQLKAEVTDAMMPGTVSIPHGWGHSRPGVAMQVARAHPGVSINDLTSAAAIDPLSGNAGLSNARVEVAAVG